jgi:hypothetical protein
MLDLCVLSSGVVLCSREFRVQGPRIRARKAKSPLASQGDWNSGSGGWKYTMGVTLGLILMARAAGTVLGRNNQESKERLAI